MRAGAAGVAPRLVGKAPFGHWTTTTFVAGLRRDGVTAPFVIKGAINGPSFRAYVTKCLAPTLRPGETVVMDNLGAHRSPNVRQAIESQGASLRYLPPYSPDLNPIELMFSKKSRGALRLQSLGPHRNVPRSGRPA